MKKLRPIITKMNLLPGVKVVSLGQDGVTIQIGTEIPVIETHPPSSAATGSGTEGAGDFTLAVTPNEAALLVFGQEKGTIWFTLVPQGGAQ